MSVLKNPKNRFYLALLLILSVATSSWIATSVNLNQDQIGALANIYVPFIVGLFTLLLFLAIIFINRKYRFTLTLCCVMLNLVTGLFLYLTFDDERKEIAEPSAQIDMQLIKSVQDEVVLENTGLHPAGNRAIFSYAYNPERPVANQAPVTNRNCQTAAIKIKNFRRNKLTVKKAYFDKKDLWDLAVTNSENRKISLPFTIAPGDSAILTVRFTANALNNRVKPMWYKAAFKLQNWIVSSGRKFNYQPTFGSTCSSIAGQLHLTTNDETKPVKTIRLNAIWEYRFENDWEPGLQTILNTLNFKTNVGFRNFDNGLMGNGVTTGSDEIPADYFERADAGKPVSILKIASYHGCCLTEDADTLAIYYPKQNITRQIQYNDQYSGQMLLPPSFNLPIAKQLVDTTGPFAIKIGSSYTDRKRNFEHKIGIRVWRAIDEHGQTMPNTLIIGSDYLGKKGTNYDYQDNVYLLKNIRSCKDSEILYSDNLLKK